jgi:hypothetical protein
MVTEKELLDAIRECEKDPITYNSIEKLANLYTVHHHLYGDRGYSHAEPPMPTVQSEVENTIGDYGDTEFLLKVKGMKADTVWKVIDELLEVLKVTNPRLYDGVIRKLEN